MHRDNKRRKRFLTAVCLLAMIFIAGQVSSPSQLLVGLADIRGGLFILFLFGLYVARPFIVVPLSVFSVFVGYRFDVSLGLPVALAGTVVTCLPPFIVARYFRVDRGILGWLSEKSEDVFDTTGRVRGMIAARLSPAPADAVSYGAGLSEMSLSAFILGTVLGELPWATAYVVGGASMRNLTVGGTQLDVRLIAVCTIISLALLAKPAYDLFQSEC